MVAYLDQETSGLPNGAGKIEGAVEKKPWTLKMRAEIELEIELQNSICWVFLLYDFMVHVHIFHVSDVQKQFRCKKCEILKADQAMSRTGCVLLGGISESTRII